MSDTPVIDEWELTETQAGQADDSIRAYLAEIGRYPLLSRTDEVRLARRAEAGHEPSKRRLAESNLRLVVVIARDFRGLGLDLLDLIQEGNLGLMTAVEKYDWRRETRFATYARWWIRQAIFDAVTNRSRLVRVPVRLAGTATRVTRTERELAQRLGRAPSNDEVARAADVTESVVVDVRRAQHAPLSLADPIGDDTLTLDDVLADEHGPDPAALLLQSSETEGLGRAVAALEGRSKLILELRYGLGESDPCTIEDIAGRVGLSRERVRRLERKALHELASSPELRSLREAA